MLLQQEQESTALPVQPERKVSNSPMPPEQALALPPFQKKPELPQVSTSLPQRAAAELPGPEALHGSPEMQAWSAPSPLPLELEQAVSAPASTREEAKSTKRAGTDQLAWAAAIATLSAGVFAAFTRFDTLRLACRSTIWIRTPQNAPMAPAMPMTAAARRL